MATTTHDFRQDRRSGPHDRRRDASLATRTDALETTPRGAAYAPAYVARGSLVEGVRVSWGGIWGGVLTAVGLLILMAALGLAVGITAADPQATDARTMGTAAGIWGGVSLLIALFVGGTVATRIGATYDGATGFWEGALVWVVSILLMAYLAASGVSNLVGGAFSLMDSASQAVGTMMQGQGDPVAAQANQAASRGQAAVEGLKQQFDSGMLQQKAAEAKPAASRTAWITFGALVLSLLAAVLGAMVGRRKHPVV